MVVGSRVVGSKMGGDVRGYTQCAHKQTQRQKHIQTQTQTQTQTAMLGELTQNRTRPVTKKTL